MFVRAKNDYVEFVKLILLWTFHCFEELYQAEDLRNQTCKNNTSKGFVQLRDGTEKGLKIQQVWDISDI